VLSSNRMYSVTHRLARDHECDQPTNNITTLSVYTILCRNLVKTETDSVK